MAFLFGRKKKNMWFEEALPEETGVERKWIVSFLERLEKQNIPMHSMIMMRRGKVIAETYYAPYSAGMKHRMFSVTKSFVSVAIGILEGEGKLKISDRIVDYFPDKCVNVPKNEDGSFAGKYAYLEEMTIEDMLSMKTCHKKTTYKFEGCDDWAGSFFTTEPSHKPGSVFSYDTSATHVLCALVERLAGLNILDFLRDRFLTEAGFSGSAYVLKNDNGQSMGGSGLCCTSRDLLIFFKVVADGGKIGDKQVIPAEYIKKATSKQSDTYAKSDIWAEMQGYGYQFWMTQYGGYCCYGMGGQYMMHFPDDDIILVVTSDCQGRKGGHQLIFDSFFEEVLLKSRNASGADVNEKDKADGAVGSAKTWENYLKSRKIPVPYGDSTSTLIKKINDKKYIFDDNDMGLKWISVDFMKNQGSLDYENGHGVGSIPFTLGENELVQLPYYKLQAAACGVFTDENTLFINVGLIDECVGNLKIVLNFKDDDVTYMGIKNEETLLKEFAGFVTGHCAG